MSKIRNEQETILNVLEAYRENGEPKLKRRKIKEEIMKTDLCVLDKESHSDGRGSKLDHIIDQALYQLKKKGDVVRTAGGEWKLTKVEQKVKRGREMYIPKPCAAITEDSEGSYCPVMKGFVGSPTRQCELLHGSEPRKIKYDSEKNPIKKSGMNVYPMKPCYFTKKPTEPQIQIARKRLELFEERQRKMMIPRTRGF